MANGSFHDELLSVHKTQTVSLTHQRLRRKTEDGQRGWENDPQISAISQINGGGVIYHSDTKARSSMTNE